MEGVLLLGLQLIKGFEHEKTIHGIMVFRDLRTHAVIDHTYQRDADELVVKELSLDMGDNPKIQLESCYLNVRQPFDPSIINGKDEIIFPDDTIFYIYDGQHRHLALELALKRDPRFNDKEIPVRITFLPKAEEVLSFFITNALRKAVSPALNQLNLDLIYRSESFIQNFKDNCGILKIPRRIQGIMGYNSAAVQYLRKLDQDIQSPLHNYILFEDEKTDPEKKKTKPIGQKTFVDYMLLSLKRMDVERFSPWMNADVNHRDKMILQYWEAIKQQMPEAFVIKTCKKYHLCGFFGVVFWNYIMPDIFQLADMNPDNLQNVLSNMGEYITSDFWNKENYKNTQGEIRNDATKSKRHAQAALEILQKNLGDKKNE